MAKKRPSYKSSPAKRKRPVPSTGATATAVAAPRVPVKATPAPEAAKKVDLATEYHYVLGDLKRIGLVAAAMFATLIALALLIR